MPDKSAESHPLPSIHRSINNPVVLQKVQDIVDHCLQSTKEDLASVSARRDAVLAELEREKECVLRERAWIRVLEKTLNEHGIPYPKYPNTLRA